MKVKNWTEFQHYKDRCPPWIKLHHELLDNYEFHCLPIASRALAPMIWLLASESKDGSLPCDVQKIAFRLHQTIDEIVSALKPLISKGFLVLEQGDSNALAERKQSAVPETEAEAEVETEGESASKLLASQQPPLNCARRLMEILNLPQTNNLIRTVEAAITAEAGYLDMSPADAAQQISSHAMEWRRQGNPLDKFYFEDTKWRNGNGTGKQSKPSASAERADRSRRNILDGFAANARRADAPDSPEREIGTRKRIGSGV